MISRPVSKRFNIFSAILIPSSSEPAMIVFLENKRDFDCEITPRYPLDIKYLVKTRHPGMRKVMIANAVMITNLEYAN